MALKTITFTCETITPMFLSGADGQTPELRPPSIKGALRFWWRAMNGHLAITENDRSGIANLLKEDEELFGGVTDGGKSKVLVRISNEKEIILNGSDLQKYAGHYTTTNRGKLIDNYKKEGLAYLYYVLLNQKVKTLEGFDTKTTFDITFSSENTKDLKETIASFWLLVHLGGIGSRARRGAGSFRVVKVLKGREYLFIQFLNETVENITTFYNDNYRKCTEILNKPNQLEGYSKDDDKYSTLTSNEIYVSNNSFTDWILALEDIGGKMRETRISYEQDNNRPFKLDDIPMKAVFGLPLQIRKSPNFEGYYVDLSDSQRRATPLIISVIKIKEKKYHWVLTYMDGLFSETDNDIVVRNSNKQVHADRYGEDFLWSIGKDHYQLIDHFMNKLSKTKIEL